MLHHCWYVCVPLYAIVVVASSITILSRSIVPISCRLNEIVSIYLSSNKNNRQKDNENQSTEKDCGKRARRVVWTYQAHSTASSGKETPPCLLHPLQYVSFVAYPSTVPLAGGHIFFFGHNDQSIPIHTHFHFLLFASFTYTSIGRYLSTRLMYVLSIVSRGSGTYS